MRNKRSGTYGHSKEGVEEQQRLFDRGLRRCGGLGQFSCGGRVLPATPEFFTKNKDTKHGLRSCCKDCKRNWERSEKQRSNPKKVARYLREFYGLTPDQYAEMVSSQGGVCKNL